MLGKERYKGDTTHAGNKVKKEMKGLGKARSKRGIRRYP
jgi:hypothetical protein